MRDPARIPRILEALRVEWEKTPDIRLGQLLVNCMGVDSDRDIVSCLFSIEDNALIRRVQNPAVDWGPTAAMLMAQQGPKEK